MWSPFNCDNSERISRLREGKTKLLIFHIDVERPEFVLVGEILNEGDDLQERSDLGEEFPDSTWVSRTKEILQYLAPEHRNEVLPENETRYVFIGKFRWIATDDSQRSSNVLLCWNPPASPVRERMVCASARIGIRDRMQMDIAIEFRDHAELTFDYCCDELRDHCG